MTTIEAHKAELEQKMMQAEKEGQWWDLANLALEGAIQYPDWFVAAAYYQAATIELVGKQFAWNPLVQEAVRANRRVRKMADELDTAQKQ